VVLRSPWLLPSAVVYVSVIVLAERLRRSPSWDVRSGWGRAEEPIRIPAQRRAPDESISQTSPGRG
jgi:hypothetical protein